MACHLAAGPGWGFSTSPSRQGLQHPGGSRSVEPIQRCQRRRPLSPPRPGRSFLGNTIQALRPRPPFHHSPKVIRERIKNEPSAKAI